MISECWSLFAVSLMKLSIMLVHLSGHKMGLEVQRNMYLVINLIKGLCIYHCLKLGVPALHIKELYLWH